MIRGWNDMQKGVEIRPGAYSGEATVCYNGLLAKSGADQVYLHYGNGSGKWSGVKTERMDHTNVGWEKTIRLNGNQAAICFKDSANNWDNNQGYNWVISQ